MVAGEAKNIFLRVLVPAFIAGFVGHQIAERLIPQALPASLSESLGAVAWEAFLEMPAIALSLTVLFDRTLGHGRAGLFILSAVLFDALTILALRPSLPISPGAFVVLGLPSALGFAATVTIALAFGGRPRESMTAEEQLKAARDREDEAQREALRGPEAFVARTAVKGLGVAGAMAVLVFGAFAWLFCCVVVVVNLWFVLHRLTGIGVIGSLGVTFAVLLVMLAVNARLAFSSRRSVARASGNASTGSGGRA